MEYYYFTRRVPADLRQHYKYPRIVQGLRTSSPQEAKLQAKIEAAKLDAYWTQMRLAKSEVLGLSLIRDGIDVRDPFVGVYYDRSKSVVTPKPIPINDLRRV